MIYFMHGEPRTFWLHIYYSDVKYRLNNKQLRPKKFEKLPKVQIYKQFEYVETRSQEASAYANSLFCSLIVYFFLFVAFLLLFLKGTK